MLKVIIELFLVASLLLATALSGKQLFAQVDGSNIQLNPTEQAFFDHLRSLCGKSFVGSETFMADGHDSWAHLDFVMHVTVCEDDRVHIPFHLSDDHSRTWMFLVENGRLRFRHDHRSEDGTPDERNLYGGYADVTGTPFEQHFPADDYTKELLQDNRGRKWSIILTEDFSTMKYRLSYSDRLIFEGTFDLTAPISGAE
jgi:hypothetical protein